MELKDALKRFRKTAGLSQLTIARKLGVQVPQYQRYEWGKTTPSADVIVKMATTFGVSADYLLGLSDEPNQKKYDDAEVAQALALHAMFKAEIQKAVLACGRVQDNESAERENVRRADAPL